MDVFCGQMTEKVLQKLKCNKIFQVRVSASMTHIFHPLDLTVNSHFKLVINYKCSVTTMVPYSKPSDQKLLLMLLPNERRYQKLISKGIANESLA